MTWNLFHWIPDFLSFYWTPKTSSSDFCSSSYEPTKLDLSRVQYCRLGRLHHGLPVVIYHGPWWTEKWHHGLGFLIQCLGCLGACFIIPLIKFSSRGYISSTGAMVRLLGEAGAGFFIFWFTQSVGVPRSTHFFFGCLEFGFMALNYVFTHCTLAARSYKSQS